MIRYSTFPRTDPPPDWAKGIVSIFQKHESTISTEDISTGLNSDALLEILGPDLQKLGFNLETSKNRADKIERPVFFGENGAATVTYQVDGYHPDWKCGLEIEAGRAWMGNAVYRDLIQALVMVDVNWLCLAVANKYRYLSSKKQMISKDYEKTANLADAIFGHSRVRMPFKLLLIGY